MRCSRPYHSNFKSSMEQIIFLFIVAVFFLSCKNQEEKSNPDIVKDTAEEVVAEPVVDLGCYTYNENGTLITLEITRNENPVEGNLTYALSEKDKNTGTFTGEFNDGKLLGMYTFQSEGKESRREIAFLFEDSQFIEGYGEMNEDGTTFKNIKAINYSSIMPLNKADCNR